MVGFLLTLKTFTSAQAHSGHSRLVLQTCFFWHHHPSLNILPSCQNMLKILVKNEGPLRTGVLTPGPCYRTSISCTVRVGAVPVPYYLNEEQGWELQEEELHRALESAKGICKPVALYVINPGNPAGIKKEIKLHQSAAASSCVVNTRLLLGQVQSRKSMQEVIRFAAEKKLFLLADEVGVPKQTTSNNPKIFRWKNPLMSSVRASNLGLSGPNSWAKH